VWLSVVWLPRVILSELYTRVVCSPVIYCLRVCCVTHEEGGGGNQRQQELYSMQCLQLTSVYVDCVETALVSVDNLPATRYTNAYYII